MSAKAVIWALIALALVTTGVWFGWVKPAQAPVPKDAEEQAVVTPTDSQAAPHVPKTAPARDPISLIAVGDIMLSRTVETKMKKAGDFTLPFKPTADVIQQADIAFANLECPVSDGGAIIPKGINFRADPRAIEGLTYAGFDVVSLANNHIGDYGPEAVNDTMDLLTEAGIKYVGGGKDDTESYAPLIVKKGGFKIAFLAFNGIEPRSFEASATRAGLAWTDETRMQNAIASVRDLVDYVFVSMHNGTEYVYNANASQKQFAHVAIDAGADMIIGHHPHVRQEKEQYKGKWIIYSLGNFVFDQMWSEETRLGEIMQTTISDDGLSDPSFTTVKIFDYNQPHIINEQ